MPPDSLSSTDGAGRVETVISKMRLAADVGVETIPGVARMIGEWADEIETAVDSALDVERERTRTFEESRAYAEGYVDGVAEERERTRVLEEALTRIAGMREYDFHTGDGDVESPPEIARDALAAVAVEDGEAEDEQR